MGGVALFARGEGTKDPSDPDQGLSVLQTQNLQTIASAFKQLGSRRRPALTRPSRRVLLASILRHVPMTSLPAGQHADHRRLLSRAVKGEEDVQLLRERLAAACQEI